jgi:hypothetical protein
MNYEKGRLWYAKAKEGACMDEAQEFKAGYRTVNTGVDE